MTAIDRPVRRLIAQEAADWFVANRAGPTAKERQTFAAWLKASPVHVEEYLALSVIARDLRAACEDSPEAHAALLARAQVEEHSTTEPFWPRIVTGVRGVASNRWHAAAVMMAGFVILSLGLVRAVVSQSNHSYTGARVCCGASTLKHTTVKTRPAACRMVLLCI